MKVLLLTGATGLLGEYLLRDLTRLGRPLAVIVRGRGMRTAADRMEDIFAKLERVERRALPRPTILEGDLHKPQLGLSAAACAWVADHCDTLLHNAASLKFVADPRSGEPYRSNVEGTAEMLALCESTGIKRLHHVSTAYVCGSRRGRILESDSLELAAAGNDYESSKIQSEQLVRDCRFLESRVIYRPAIIVGDHLTGYTSSFHGFYVPLQLCEAMRASGSVSQDLTTPMILGTLGLTGQERKNFVPVDWVSAVISRGVNDQSGRLHEQAIHLAPRQRVSLTELAAAFAEAMQTFSERSTSNKTGGRGGEASQMLDFFRQQMSVYQAYWRDDPEFDVTGLAQWMPDLPCPEVDHQAMLRLCRYALRSNFGARKALPAVHPPRLASMLQATLDRSALKSSGAAGTGAAGDVGVCVTGPGGGDFNLQIASDPAEFEPRFGLPTSPSPRFRLSRPTLDALLEGATTVEECLKRGRIMRFQSGAENQPAGLGERALECLIDRLRGQEASPLPPQPIKKEA